MSIDTTIVRGTVCKNWDFARSQADVPYLRFTVLIPPRQRRNKHTGEWEDVAQPVFQQVIAFNRLAENMREWISAKQRVIVVGHLQDDSYIPSGADPSDPRAKVVRTIVVAQDIGPSASNAELTVTPQADEWAAPAAAAAAG